MAWKKGAVVIQIKKHGDEEWADEMEKALNVQRAADKEREELERDNKFMKRHIVEDLEAKIAKAEYDYGYNWIPPKWLLPFIQVWALLMYGISLFAHKYLIIKDNEDNEDDEYDE